MVYFGRWFLGFAINLVNEKSFFALCLLVSHPPDYPVVSLLITHRLRRRARQCVSMRMFGQKNSFEWFRRNKERRHNREPQHRLFMEQTFEEPKRRTVWTYNTHEPVDKRNSIIACVPSRSCVALSHSLLV